MTGLSARRTFWEKATALHAEAHRPKESPTPRYFSRHYYDIAILLDTDDGNAAAADNELLELVALERTRVSGPATREIAVDSASEIAAA